MAGRQHHQRPANHPQLQRYVCCTSALCFSSEKFSQKRLSWCKSAGVGYYRMYLWKADHTNVRALRCTRQALAKHVGRFSWTFMQSTHSKGLLQGRNQRGLQSCRCTARAGPRRQLSVLHPVAIFLMSAASQQLLGCRSASQGGACPALPHRGRAPAPRERRHAPLLSQRHEGPTRVSRPLCGGRPCTGRSHAAAR